MKNEEVAMTWLSLVMVISAVGGITGCLIYLRIALRAASQCRSVDQLVIACMAAALIGFGLATLDCLSSGQCFTPQRTEFSQWERQWEHMQLVSFGRQKTPAQP
jgi:hypothetical protein